MTYLEGATPDPKLGAPSVPELLQSAVARHQAGELEPAEELYRQVLANDPDNADALHLLGVIAYQVRNYAAALELIGAAIRRRDQVPAFHNNFGNVLRDQGFWDQALVAYASAVTLDPTFVEAHTNLGLVLHRKGKIEEALMRHDKALALRPDHAVAHFNRGRALRDLEQEDEAAAALEAAIACKPDFGAAHNTLGNLHQQAGRRDAAEPCYLRAVTLDPEDVDAHNNLGSLLMTDGRLGEAVVRFERALSLRPDFADAWSNLGATSQKQGCVEAAARAFRQAIELAPDNAEAHWNLALALLLQGEYEAGWPEYEWRARRRAASPPREFAAPRWSGEALDGRAILLHAEQGLGDTLQFVRYAALVARRGGRVVLECQPELTALLASVPGVAEVRAGGAPLPPVAAHAALMSLPLIFATRAETIPTEVPYITVPEAAARRWAARLGESEQPSVRPGLGRQSGSRQRCQPIHRPGLPAAAAVERRAALRLASGRRAGRAAGAVRRRPGSGPERRAHRLRRDRRGDLRPRSGDHGRYLGRSPGRRARPSGLAAVALRARLSLAAGARGQPLVPDHEAISPGAARRLGVGGRAGGRSAQRRLEALGNVEPISARHRGRATMSLMMSR